MLLTFEETVKLISEGKYLHLAGTEDLLKKLPKGNWIGGSTEYFMARAGGKVTNKLIYINPYYYYDCFKIKTYDVESIADVTTDAYDNGFSILILPFDSEIHKLYADKASEFDGMFMKNIAGWVSGINLGASGQTPIAVNGLTGEVCTDKAVAMHVCVPDDKVVNISIVNIFSADENSPVIKFQEEGFEAKNCTINGEEVVFSEYLEQNGIDVKLPLIGDYAGAGVNVSFKAIGDDGIVSFYAPVFSNIEYRFAKPIDNYEEEFRQKLLELKSTEAVFSCNCILNFLYGELEDKHVDAFFGPITFGEVAYQLVNQTLVYVTVS